MHLVDWGIVAALLVVLTVGAATTRRHATTVAGFLAAERCGGRYIIAVSDNMARLGVITLVWYFEQHYDVGFTAIWWTLMEEPVMIVMALSGWVVYRFRQTRAMTLAEFFEMRYSRSFRVFAGIVAFVAGMINFGIFPSVGARFFIRLWAWPDAFHVFGTAWPTFEVTMFVLLAVPMALLLAGGQIAVMVTDFLQGVVANVAFIAINAFLLFSFSWDSIRDTLMAAPPGKSMVDPFDLGQESNFNVLYYFITVVTLFYAARAWQGTQGYNCSAINAHEAKMSFILGQWRFRVLMLITIVLPICIKTFLTHPDYVEQAAGAHAAIAEITEPQMQVQLRTPIVMRDILPAGLIGLASAAMLGAFISTHDTYMHSWAAIFVQDVVLPFRRRRLSERAHLILLRVSVLAIAVFIFGFSYYFQHVQYIAMYCALSAAVFIGGAGAAIIGGLYWNRGTAAAAWSAMIAGMVLSGGGILIKQAPVEQVEALRALAAPLSWIGSAMLYLRSAFTGQEMNFIAIAASSLIYVAVSLMQNQRFDLDRLLHRGRYAMAGESSLSIRDARGVWEKLGFSREFTGMDRVVTYVTLSWPLFWSFAFVGGSIYAMVFGIPADDWLVYWHVWLWVVLGAGIIVTVWLSIGGMIDLRRMYRLLRAKPHDSADDGEFVQNETSTT